ncbi:hypothetical protein QIA27_05035 (plasmid) [Borreliella tanukii]
MDQKKGIHILKKILNTKKPILILNNQSDNRILDDTKSIKNQKNIFFLMLI